MSGHAADMAEATRLTHRRDCVAAGHIRFSMAIYRLLDTSRFDAIDQFVTAIID